MALTPLERYFRSVAAEEPDVRMVDLDHVVCPRLRCDAVVRDMIASCDVDHITGTPTQRQLAPQVESVLRQQAILGP